MIKIINKYGAIILINETVFKLVKMNSENFLDWKLNSEVRIFLIIKL